MREPPQAVGHNRDIIAWLGYQSETPLRNFLVVGVIIAKIIYVDLNINLEFSEPPFSTELGPKEAYEHSVHKQKFQATTVSSLIKVYIGF